MSSWCEGKEQTVKVTVGELPAEVQQAAAHRHPPANRPTELAGLGLRVGPISPETRDPLFPSPPEQKGVVIMEVAPDSPAAGASLRPGDVIVEVQQERVNTPQEVQARLEALRKQNRPTALLLIETRAGPALRAAAAARREGQPGLM